MKLSNRKDLQKRSISGAEEGSDVGFCSSRYMFIYVQAWHTHTKKMKIRL